MRTPPHPILKLADDDDLGLLAPGMILGTSASMAPEQARCRGVRMNRANLSGYTRHSSAEPGILFRSAAEMLDTSDSNRAERQYGRFVAVPADLISPKSSSRQSAPGLS